MLNELKNKIDAYNFKSYKNTKISYGELFISADDFTGYNLIKEFGEITELIDLQIYDVEHLNDNIIKIKLK